MTVEIFPNGPFGVNSFIVYENDTFLVIDPGSDIEEIISFLSRKKAHPSHILITHPHIDHVQGINQLKKLYPDAQVFISNDGLEFLSDIPAQAHRFGLPDPGSIHVDITISSENPFSAGCLEIKPLSVPGHSPGSLAFLIQNTLFTGDTLFRGTIGRSDLPGGNGKLLGSSIISKLLTLPEDTIVYPGHGEPTTIGREKNSNPYFAHR